MGTDHCHSAAVAESRKSSAVAAERKKRCMGRVSVKQWTRNRSIKMRAEIVARYLLAKKAGIAARLFEMVD
jgi:hypothetical protein